MGHEVTGLVCPLSGVAALSEMTGFKHHDLNAGMSFFHLGWDQFKSFPDAGSQQGFWDLTTVMVDHIVEMSNRTMIAYVETAYFGGEGSQGAMLVDKGAIILDGPSKSMTKVEPINQALALMGVVKAPNQLDEFDTVGLGKHRSNRRWLEFSVN